MIPKLKFGKLIFFAAAASFLFFEAHMVSGAFFYVTAPQKAEVGERFTADVMFSAQGDEVNAIEGSLNVNDPDGATKFVQIFDGGSPVDVWISSPKMENSKVFFSGVMPGGLSDNGRKIFSVEFIAEKEGAADFNISGAKALLNDGQGSAAETRLNNSTVIIVPKNSNQQEESQIIDSIPPYDIETVVTRSPGVMDGRNYIFLSGHDDIYGIEGFEIMEEPPFGSFRSVTNKIKWVDCINPCALGDQSLESRVFVKATDRAGNYKIVVVEPINGLPWFKNILIVGLGIIFGAAIIATIFKKITK